MPVDSSSFDQKFAYLKYLLVQGGDSENISRTQAELKEIFNEIPGIIAYIPTYTLMLGLLDHAGLIKEEFDKINLPLPQNEICQEIVKRFDILVGSEDFKCYWHDNLEAGLKIAQINCEGIIPQDWL